MATSSGQPNQREVTAFTPGPWATGGDLSKTQCTVFARRGATTRRIAKCDPSVYMTEAECQANARLIAAAPDLYAALKEAIQWSPYKGESEETPFLRRARAAIRAVEGGGQ